jgi:hypothetical protein
MRLLILAGLLSVSGAVSAQESKPLVLPDFSNVAPKPDDGRTKVSFDMKCEGRDGQTLKPGQVGFETCVGDRQKGTPSERENR